MRSVESINTNICIENLEGIVRGVQPIRNTNSVLAMSIRASPNIAYMNVISIGINEDGEIVLLLNLAD
jgi:hypothetical protein